MCVAVEILVSNVIELPPHSAVPASIVISSPKSPPSSKLPALKNTPESKFASLSSAITNLIVYCSPGVTADCAVKTVVLPSKEIGGALFGMYSPKYCSFCAGQKPLSG